MQKRGPDLGDTALDNFFVIASCHLFASPVIVRAVVAIIPYGCHGDPPHCYRGEILGKILGIEYNFCLLFFLQSSVSLLLLPKVFDGLGNMLAPALTPQGPGAPLMAGGGMATAAPAKPISGDLDSSLANLVGSMY